MWCRAFHGSAVTPPVLRAMRLWEIGVLLNGDIGAPAPRIVIEPEPRAPGEKPKGPRLRNVD